MNEVDELLATAEVRLLEAERNKDQAIVNYDTALADRDALRRLVAAHRGTPVPEKAPTPWARMTRADAILMLLRETGEPMAPREIADALTAKGRVGENYNKVSQTINNMKARDQVYSPNRGYWTVTRSLTVVPAGGVQQTILEGGG